MITKNQQNIVDLLISKFESQNKRYKRESDSISFNEKNIERLNGLLNDLSHLCDSTGTKMTTNLVYSNGCFMYGIITITMPQLPPSFNFSLKPDVIEIKVTSNWELKSADTIDCIICEDGLNYSDINQQFSDAYQVVLSVVRKFDSIRELFKAKITQEH